MFFKIVRRMFWTWWDNLSYSILTSLFGAMNPIYLAFLAGCMWALSVDFQLFVDYKDSFIILAGIAVMSMNVFPTTLAACSIQGRLIDGKVRKFVKEYFAEVKRLFWRGMGLTLVNALAGYLLSYSFLFYRDRLADWFPVNYILIGLSALFYLVLLLSQIILVPLAASDDYPLFEYYLIATHMTFKNGFVLFGVGVFHLLLMAILTIPVVTPFLVIVPVVAFYGLTFTLHIWAFRYADGQVSAEEDWKRRSGKELLSPFTAPFKKRKIDDNEEDKEGEDGTGAGSSS